jgi:hypothetical protein
MQFPTTLIVARGVAIILVLLFHAQIFLFAVDLAYAPYWKAVNFLTYMLMPLLFLLSGLSMPFLMASRSAVYLYLYLLWTLIHFTATALFKHKLTEFGFEDLIDLASRLVVPQSILWFLYALVIYIIVARIIGRMSVAHQLAISLAMAGLVEFVNVDFATRAVIQNFFFFLVGLHYRSQLTELFSRKAHIGILVSGTLYCLIFAGARWAGLDRAPLLNEALGLLGVAATLFACRLMAVTPLRHVIRPIGRHTLQIYLLHLLFFEAIWYAVSATPAVQSSLVGMLGPFLLTGASLAGSIAASRILRNVPGLFVAPEWALKLLTPPLERLIDVGSTPLQRQAHMPTPKAPR